jgi:hypothetical protein
MSMATTLSMTELGLVVVVVEVVVLAVWDSGLGLCCAR